MVLLQLTSQNVQTKFVLAGLDSNSICIVAGHLQQALHWSEVATARFHSERGIVTDIMPAKSPEPGSVQCIPLDQGCSQLGWCIAIVQLILVCNVSWVVHQFNIEQMCNSHLLLCSITRFRDVHGNIHFVNTTEQLILLLQVVLIMTSMFFFPQI